MKTIDIENPKRPTHIFDERVFAKNIEELQDVSKRSGLKVLLALKGYNPTHSAHMVNRGFSGIAVSSEYELLSAEEHYDVSEIHLYCPAYDDETFDNMIGRVSHVVFNSHYDLCKFAPRVPSHVKIDVRVNLQHTNSADVEVFDGYNPNLPKCRFGITKENLNVEELIFFNVTGIHFHALNAQGAQHLVEATNTFEDKFGDLLHRMDRLNFGGGHKICQPDYDYDLLVEHVLNIQSKYGVQTFIEPSEFVFSGVGTLKARVLSFLENEGSIAILNCSAKNHMPDILESCYYHAEIQEGVFGHDKGGEFKYTLGGHTCLTSDVIGDYSFDKPLQAGDTITFTGQTTYTMVLSTYFNGISRPDYVIIKEDGTPYMYMEDSYFRYTQSIGM